VLATAHPVNWLNINERIEYRLLSLTYKALTTSGVGSNLEGGAECRREAPAEIFWMCTLTFLLCPLTFLFFLVPPPHEGAQRLFVTD